MRIVGNLQVLGTRSILQFNPTPDNNLEYSGWITLEYVSVSVSVGQLLYFDPTIDKWALAQANSLTTMPARAIALETKTSGQICRMLRYGTFRNDSWTLNTSGVYVSATTAGALVTTPPTTSGQIVQLIATPTDPKVAFFDFCPMYIQIA